MAKVKTLDGQDLYDVTNVKIAAGHPLPKFSFDLPFEQANGLLARNGTFILVDGARSHFIVPINASGNQNGGTVVGDVVPHP